MRLSVLYFAWVRERMGRDQDAVEAHAGSTVADLLDQLAAAHPGAFADRAMIRAAVNQAVAPMTTALRDGDEVAFFPPMTGG